MVPTLVLLLLALMALGYTNAQSQPVAPQILSSVINMNGIEADFVFAPETSGGAQVMVNVRKGLSKQFAVSPTSGFDYHIHVKPVGPNNDCSATGGHLDPTNVGAAKCNPLKPDSCQEGDLSGKHGSLKATEAGDIPTLSYVDRGLKFSGVNTTIAGRSVVIHNNGARVACGDILPIGVSRDGSSSSSSSSVVINPDSHNTEASQQASGSSGVAAMGWGVMITVVGTLATGILGGL